MKLYDRHTKMAVFRLSVAGLIGLASFMALPNHILLVVAGLLWTMMLSHAMREWAKTLDAWKESNERWSTLGSKMMEEIQRLKAEKEALQQRTITTS